MNRPNRRFFLLYIERFNHGIIIIALYLKWRLTNTGIETDRNGNIVSVKNQSRKRRIDGSASLLDAYVVLFDNYEQFLRAL